ncbi:hypothetical protein BCR36DRAFT_373482 [Piromyces finnis]|uniref:Uncharacterized protein n=1 Tax=Piromyces finnis TaxID=1754191 RepID=A0A1Y1UZQ4_9FUNG|nr:hypothetical protein BCR36DRAFT_373482 [Piromyces finnis]|eukprot:ORX44184.1 hypothetical protein BCR36DRAFT_373482 [Piromyces finnis]
MPFQMTEEFRESVIRSDRNSIDLSYYPSITKDILKMNSIMISTPYKSNDGGLANDDDDEQELLFDPNEMFNNINSKTKINKIENPPATIDENKEINNTNDANDLCTPVQNNFMYDDPENEDTGTIKYKKLPNSKTSNSILSNNSDTSFLNNDSLYNFSFQSNDIIEEANTLLSLPNNEENTVLYDEMLTKLEITMEYEIKQIRYYFQNKKDSIITELQRRFK